jgi:predicted DNA-binding protein
MGRPPLNKKIATVATQVRFPADIRDRIEAIAGKGRMAAFVREAVIAELERREDSDNPEGRPLGDGL